MDALAAGLLAEVDRDSVCLASYTILLPTRRATRLMREAFLRQSDGQALLLPRMFSVSDPGDVALFGCAGQGVTDIPMAVDPLHRCLLLTRLIEVAPGAAHVSLPDRALLLAEELSRFLDHLQTEGYSLDDVSGVVPGNYAQHWQKILEFLDILSTHWPALLQSLGLLDPVEFRNKKLRAWASIWAHTPPTRPIIAAGITGSVPVVADLLDVIMGLSQGRLVLPGLDMHLDEISWACLDETHPQYVLKRLLERLDVSRSQVGVWPAHFSFCGATQDREKLLSEALRPAATTHMWRLGRTIPEAAISGLSYAECATPQEEGMIIALMMRHTLCTPEKTCALVTPDRDLARRVSSELRRWGILIDDSAGRPLAVTPPGSFLRLSAAMVADHFSPVALLAVLKHPLCNAGMDPAVFRDTVRQVEKSALRGVRPAPGLKGLRKTLHALDFLSLNFDEFLTALDTCCADFAALMAEPKAPFAALVEAHMRMAEMLAATPDKPGPLWLWGADAGVEAAAFAARLGEYADVMGDFEPRYYPRFLDSLMRGHMVRTRFGSHPRLDILGPMEARLHYADVMIIGSFNENVWPMHVVADPWMSRSMRHDVGLPVPEQGIGHMAHDLVSIMSAPQVLMTRAHKVDGTPAVPSRWLLRLQTCLSAADRTLPKPEYPWDVWAYQFDQPIAMIAPRRPAPRPPVAARPQTLSVTQIETWMRDPYALYARHILHLRALDPLDAQPGAADYGTLVHRALEDFVRRFSHDIPRDMYAELLESGRSAFMTYGARPSVEAFWWPRFKRLAAWVVQQEYARRALVRDSFVEVSGQIAVGGFVVTATADRLDLLQDGRLVLIDYKTGAPPSSKEVAAGFSPQLPLEALIAVKGGFPGVPSGREIASLLYWHLKGGRDGGEEKDACASGVSPTTLIQEAVSGLEGLIAAFGKETTPYEARPYAAKAPKYSDFLHLARVREWAAASLDEGGSG